MTDPKKDEKAFGLDMPFDEAIERFAKVTKAEIEAEGLPPTELIPEGHEEHVPFKGHDIRKVFHDGEWYFSIIDVVEALKSGFTSATERMQRLTLHIGIDYFGAPTPIAGLKRLRLYLAAGDALSSGVLPLGGARGLEAAE